MNPSAKPLILVVDDTPINIRLLASILEANYEIGIATNGTQALAMVADTHPDLILLDVMMPDLNGYEVCRRLKAEPSTASIPVIFLTAKTETDDIIEGFRAGGSDYLSKPFLREELCARVEVHIRIQSLLHELEERNQQLQHLAETDTLTGIANRRFILDRMEETVRLARRHQHDCALIMLDIDHFKAINDRYGHPVGDRVLIGVANAIKSCIRSSDWLGRYGGEEFLVCLPHTDRENACAVAEKIRKQVQDLSWEQPELKATISAGIATLRTDEDLAGFIQRSDKTLYQAKEDGRNRVCCSDD